MLDPTVPSLRRARRRDFLRALGIGAATLVLDSAPAFAAGSKPLRGIFPIAQTPFTESNQLDIEVLVEQLRFIDRGRVHGYVWPQLASEWSTLTEAERLEGAEAIASAGKRLRPAIVLGVQGPDLATAIRYAKHAEKAGADAIISLPPANQKDPQAIVDYYKAVGRATGLPLFVQAIGDMGVELIVRMYKEVPTLRYIKDEAGQPLKRIAQFREQSRDELKVFTGAHGRTQIDEMHRGFAGNMPAASFADLYAASWDLWHEGKRKESMDIFSKAAMLIHEVGPYGLESLKYLLYLRGVFKTWRTRDRQPGAAPSAEALAAGAAGTRASGLDQAGMDVLREMLEFVKPYLRA